MAPSMPISAPRTIWPRRPFAMRWRTTGPAGRARCGTRPGRRGCRASPGGRYLTRAHRDTPETGCALAAVAAEAACSEAGFRRAYEAAPTRRSRASAWTPSARRRTRPVRPGSPGRRDGADGLVHRRHLPGAGGRGRGALGAHPGGLPCCRGAQSGESGRAMTGPKRTPSPLDAYPVRTFDTVRYGDTDRQGHVNNAVFSTYLESGRVTLLLDPDAPLADPGAAFVIARLTLDFLGDTLARPDRHRHGRDLGRAQLRGAASGPVPGRQLRGDRRERDRAGRPRHAPLPAFVGRRRPAPQGPDRDARGGGPLKLGPTDEPERLRAKVVRGSASSHSKPVCGGRCFGAAPTGRSRSPRRALPSGRHGEAPRERSGGRGVRVFRPCGRSLGYAGRPVGVGWRSLGNGCGTEAAAAGRGGAGGPVSMFSCSYGDRENRQEDDKIKRIAVVLQPHERDLPREDAGEAALTPS